MTLPLSPPTRAQAGQSLKLGSSGWPVFALQKGLNDSAGFSLTADGAFGPSTDEAVKTYQARMEVGADGVVGPTTRRLLADAVARRVDREIAALPDGLIRQMASLEGGDNAGAVNPDVPGGTDCGLFQIRCYEPYNETALRRAFSPYDAGIWAANDPDHGFLPRQKKYFGSSWAWSKSDLVRSQRVALMAHNWPAGAESIARFGVCSSPLSQAGWIPRNADGTSKVHFQDGTRVETRWDWCLFYAMGTPPRCGPTPANVRWGS